MIRRTLIALLLLGASASQAQQPGEVALFNGRDFAGWTFYLEEKLYNAGGQGKISDFATIRPGGIIELNPQLHGALMTQKDYLNYKLHVEFRWVDPKARNNSGLFLRIRPPFVWDSVHGEQQRTYMVQIQPPNTGELWVLGYSDSSLRGDPARGYKPFGARELPEGAMGSSQLHRHHAARNAEKPAGEWNAIDVTLVGKTIQVWVNGELVNEGEGLVDLPGRIGLESEFGPIQFRNLRLTELPAEAVPPKTSVPPPPQRQRPPTPAN